MARRSTRIRGGYLGPYEPVLEGGGLVSHQGREPDLRPGPGWLDGEVLLDTIKLEVMALFDEFFVGSIDLARLNFGIITPIPKVLGAGEVSLFQLIMVINVIFRILAKG